MASTPPSSTTESARQGGKVDWWLLLPGSLLLVSISAFALGAIPYPFGLIVLGVLLVARLVQLRSGRGANH